jgi:hypothetical protein
MPSPIKGFYSPLLKPRERRDLSSPQGGQPPLQDEIDLHRVIMRRMFTIAQDQPPEEAIKTLTMLSITASRMAGLLRVQEVLRRSPSADNEFNIAREIALREIAKELFPHHPEDESSDGPLSDLSSSAPAGVLPDFDPLSSGDESFEPISELSPEDFCLSSDCT